MLLFTCVSITLLMSGKIFTYKYAQTSSSKWGRRLIINFICVSIIFPTSVQKYLTHPFICFIRLFELVGHNNLLFSQKKMRLGDTPHFFFLPTNFCPPTKNNPTPNQQNVAFFISPSYVQDMVWCCGMFVGGNGQTNTRIIFSVD